MELQTHAQVYRVFIWVFSLFELFLLFFPQVIFLCKYLHFIGINEVKSLDYFVDLFMTVYYPVIQKKKWVNIFKVMSSELKKKYE